MTARALLSNVAALALAIAAGGCSSSPGADAVVGRPIVAGDRVGPIALDQTWAEVRAAVGAPPQDPVVLTRLGFVTWPALGLEALLTSPDEQTLTDDALVIGVAATAAADFRGAVRPGMSRAAIEAELGAAPDAYGGRAYYEAGLAIEYRDDVAVKVAVIAPFHLTPEPPPMAPARSSMQRGSR